MNLSLSLPGDDAPDIALDGARLTLTYASAEQYSARISDDDAAVRALPDVIAVASSVDELATLGAPVGAGRQRVSYVLAPAPAPKSLPTEQPKPRR